MQPAPSTVVPAPWQLKGRGYMFLYRFPRSLGSLQRLLPDEAVAGSFRGGLGALMLVDYQQSNVGPYQELLLIPGRFAWGKKRRYSISRIWVSSVASVVSGRANWGIPKFLADFTVTRRGASEEWRVAADGKEFFKANVQHGRLPLPVNTRLLPFPLLQWQNGQGFLTNFTGRGTGRMATLTQLACDGEVFPDITTKKPLFGLAIEPFYVQFPVAEMVAPLVSGINACNMRAEVT